MRQRFESYRIEMGGMGVGEAGDLIVRNRAREIATMNGREFPTEHDFTLALLEFRNVLGEFDDELRIEEVETLGSSVAPASHGHRAPRLEPEDERHASDVLFHEGMDEAERELRLESSTNGYLI